MLNEAPLAADVLVALVDLGSLREAGALLVDGLGGEEPRHLRPQRGQAHRAVVLEERMEGVVADPGLVPEDVLAEVPDLLQDLADVVDGAVVGRELDAGEPEGALRLVALRVRHQRVRPDLLPEPVLVPGVPVDGADHAEGVSRGGEEDRDRSRLDERALVDGLVVVAVEQDEVPSPQHRVRDHLVRAAGAVQDEVGLVGPEHLRGVALRLRGGALVDQQVAEVHVGVAEIVAEDPLSEVLEEELAGGGLPVELAALVTRAVEGDVGLGVVGHEAAEERGQQAHPVVDDAGHDLLGVEGGGLLSEVDVAFDLSDHFQHADVRDPVRVGEGPQRRPEAHRPYRARQLLGRFQALFDVDPRDVGADGGVFRDVPVEVIGHFDLEALRRDVVEELPRLRVLAVHERDHFQQLGERDRYGGGSHLELGPGPGGWYDGRDESGSLEISGRHVASCNSAARQ